MKLIELKCPNCNADMTVNSELKKTICNFCGTEMLIDDEISNHKIINGFEFGYEQEMGRLKAQEEYQREKDEKIREEERLIKEKADAKAKEKEAQNKVFQEEIRRITEEKQLKEKRQMLFKKRVDIALNIASVLLGFIAAFVSYQKSLFSFVIILLLFGFIGMFALADNEHLKKFAWIFARAAVYLIIFFVIGSFMN